MKITKFIAPLILTASATLPLVSLTNCGGDPEPAVKETAKEYIYNRTFSLQCYGEGLSEGKAAYAYAWGTCWILADATPNDSKDFKYYIATNWHVQKGIESIEEWSKESSKQETLKTSFGCGTSTEGIDPKTEFVEFTKYTKVADEKSSLDGKTTITTTEEGEAKKGLQGCDFHVALADFSSCEQSEASSAAVAKKKLTTLNKFTAAGQKITRIAPTTNDSNHFEEKDLYTGGYPATIQNPTWEFHKLSDKCGTYGGGSAKVKLSYKKQGKTTHWSDDSNAPLTDCSPQYAYTGNEAFVNFMNGGASGSMLIADFGSESSHNWKVIGIYWGGFGETIETKKTYVIKPYFSIFNSNWKNYVSEWVK